ncbi:hypothetical protein REPUB_Repub08aG0238100 [Reevesia pubescens]
MAKRNGLVTLSYQLMVELVPAKQSGVNGRTMEESMVNTEFWYAEVGSRTEGRNKSARESKRWWFPLPQVPKTGLSDTERKKLQCKGKVVHQVFKAAKSINDNVLLEMPLPSIIRDALPKDVGHSVLEAYARVLRNLGFSIMSKDWRNSGEDALSNPDSPVATLCFPGVNVKMRNMESPACGGHARQAGTL